MSGGFVDPDRTVFAELRALDQSYPVEMLNLVRLRERAAYADGTVASGAEAYAEYSRLSFPIFERVGGRILWSARPEITVIGPAEDRWDIAFIARYPTGQAFLNMVRDPEYRAIVHHRQAAVETSRLVRSAPREAEVGFG